MIGLYGAMNCRLAGLFNLYGYTDRYDYSVGVNAPMRWIRGMRGYTKEGRDVRIYMCARTRGIELDDDFESIARGVFHL